MLQQTEPPSQGLLLEGFKGWEFSGGLRGGSNGIFINFMLMRQNEIYSLDFICPWVWLANGTNWISAIYLPAWGDLSYLPLGWGAA